MTSAPTSPSLDHDLKLAHELLDKPVDPRGSKPFVITVSSRALFDLEEADQYFQAHGEAAYEKYQRENEDKVLAPGAAFPFVKKILALNARLKDIPGSRRFEVWVMSRNSTDSSMRIINSIDHYGLPIMRSIFTSGTPTSSYLKAVKPDLILSSNQAQVKTAIEEGFAAAAIFPHASNDPKDGQIRIAFDGDAVLFSDEAEKVYAQQGLVGFRHHETEKAEQPLPDGPMKGLIQAVSAIQAHFVDNREDCPIRTALVTARAQTAIKRPINTLRQWGVRIDEAMALGGASKGAFLRAFDPDLFFDDSIRNVENAVEHGVSSGHVSYGVRNEAGAQEHHFTGGGPAPDGAAHLQVAVAPDLQPTVAIGETVRVRDLAHRMEVNPRDITKALFKHQVAAAADEIIDFATAAKAVEELGFKAVAEKPARARRTGPG